MDSKYFYFKMMEIVDLVTNSPQQLSWQGEMLAWSKIDPRHLASLYVLQIPYNMICFSGLVFYKFW